MSKQSIHQGKRIRIERTFPENLQSHYVSNIVVQHEPDVFVLSFFEVWPPIILADSEEEKIKMFGELEHVEAKCVARLVVSPVKMKEFIEAMQENYKNYERSISTINRMK